MPLPEVIIFLMLLFKIVVMCAFSYILYNSVFLRAYIEYMNKLQGERAKQDSIIKDGIQAAQDSDEKAFDKQGSS